MKNALKSLSLIVALVGCLVQNQGGQLLLGNNAAPSLPPSCSVSAAGQEFLAVGVLDIQSYGVTPPVQVLRPYVYNPVVTNQMLSVSTDTTGFANFGEIRADANDISVVDLNATYQVLPDSPPPATVDNLAQQIATPKAILGTNTLVTPGQGKGVASTFLFPTDILTELAAQYGGDFDVYVHITADGHTQDNRVFASNEVVYTVHVCEGCLHPNCPKGEVVDSTTVCNLGQDSVPGCIAPP